MIFAEIICDIIRSQVKRFALVEDRARLGAGEICAPQPLTDDGKKPVMDQFKSKATKNVISGPSLLHLITTGRNETNVEKYERDDPFRF